MVEPIRVVDGVGGRVAFTLTVPQSWYELDLVPATRAASIRRLVEDRVRGDVQLWVQRRPLMKVLEARAQGAHDAGATYCAAFSVPTEAGPVTGSVMVSLVGDPATVLVDPLADVLAAGGVSRELPRGVGAASVCGAGSVTAPTREQVSAAMSRLEAARGLAAEAGLLRVADGREAASRIHEAAEAGIAPRSFWSKAGQVLASAWHVAVAKVVVAVLGVVALIIGGPIAWVVFAAALLVLADTLMKYSRGQASLLDVGLALLSCIPGVKGLTTLGELAAAFKAGGMLAAGAHLLGALRTAGIGIVRMAQRFRQGAVPAVTSIVGELAPSRARLMPRAVSNPSESYSMG